MGITRKLLNWCDTKFVEAILEEDDRKRAAKAFAGGAVEGFIDAAIVMYVPVLVACYVFSGKLNKK